MTTQQFFAVGNHNIGWISDNFNEQFADMAVVIPETLELKSKVLGKAMINREILVQLQPQESTLGELAYALQHDEVLSKNDRVNIFYVRNNKGNLWVAYFHWDSGRRFWGVGARPIDYYYGWSDGNQLISRSFGTVTPPPSYCTYGRCPQCGKVVRK